MGSKNEYKYDVFLMHSTEDRDITEKIYDVLKKNGLRVAADFDWESFPRGKPVSESIRSLVRESHKSVLVLTRTAIESPWINLETILALEESKYRGNQLVLRLLLIDVSEDDVPALKVGCLERLPHFIAKFNEDGWEKKLLDSLNEPLHVVDVLPVGSLAHGLVYSHFTGLLSVMLPTKLKEAITKWDGFENNKDRTCTNYNMLVPQSCKLIDSLSGKDEKSGIEIKLETSIKFTTDHMGKPREFNITMYRISDGNEFYIFYADMPFVLNCVYELKEKQLAEGVDTHLQCERFKHTYNTLVNHQDFGRRLDNPLRVLEYDDEQTNHYEVLFEAVKNSVNDPDGEVIYQKNTTVTQAPESTVAQADQIIDGVYVSCSDDAADRTIGKEIVDYLNSKNITAVPDSGDAKGAFTMSENYIWYVFVISKKSLKDNTFCFRLTQILEHSVNENTTKLIPVLRDVDIKLVPGYIRWVTMLSTSDAKFCDHIYQTIIGGPVTMIEKMPCGDVVTGLCWAYLINYMKMALFLRTPDADGGLDFKGRIKAFLRTKNLSDSCGCPDKVFILWPSSCDMKNAIEIEANKKRIFKLGSLPPVRANTGGQINRTFTFSVFKHTNPNTQQSTCFIAEYCTPMGCLYQMGTKYGFAGVNKEDLSTQGQSFKDAFETFTSLPAVKKKLGDIQTLTKFLYYDDSKKSLIDVIEEQLNQETNLVFAAED